MGILSRLGYSSSGHSSRHSSSRRRYRHRHHHHRRHHYRRHHRHYYRSMGHSRAYSRPMIPDEYLAQRMAHKQMAMERARLHHHARMRMAGAHPIPPIPRFRPIF